MKITFLKNVNKKLNDFKDREWKLIHPEHYGEKLNRNYWTLKKVRIKAEDQGTIAGGLVGQVVGGVFYIDELIIDHKKRMLGIGKEILKKAEVYARKNKAHITYLYTGEKWDAVRFYEKLGFKKTAIIKKFFSKKDFWLMTKYL